MLFGFLSVKIGKQSNLIPDGELIVKEQLKASKYATINTSPREGIFGRDRMVIANVSNKRESFASRV